MKRMGFMRFVLGLFLFSQVAQADWTAAKRLTWTSGRSDCPAIAVDSSGYLHLIWTDDTCGHDEIYYKRSTDIGATWSAGQRLTWSVLPSYNPAIVADAPGILHVVWQGLTLTNQEIYYKKSVDGGTTWTISKRLTWTEGESTCPAFAVGPSAYLHVAWSDGTPGNEEIY